MQRMAAIMIWLIAPNQTAFPEPFQVSGQETPFQIYDNIEKIDLPEDFNNVLPGQV